MRKPLFRAGCRLIRRPLLPIVAQCGCRRRRQFLQARRIREILAALGAVPILHGTFNRAGRCRGIVMHHIMRVIQLWNLNTRLGIAANAALLMLQARILFSRRLVNYPPELMCGLVCLAAAATCVPMVLGIARPNRAVRMTGRRQHGVRGSNFLRARRIGKKLSAAGAGPVFDAAVRFMSRFHAIMILRIVPQRIRYRHRINLCARLIQQLAAGITGIVCGGAGLSAGRINSRMLRFHTVRARNGKSRRCHGRLLPIALSLEDIRTDLQRLQADGVRPRRCIGRNGKRNVADMIRLIVVLRKGHPCDFPAADIKTGQIL